MKTDNRKDKSAPQPTQLVDNPNAGALIKRSFSTKAEAQAFAAQLKADNKAGPDASPRTIPPLLTVAEAVGRFYDRMVLSGVRAATLMAYEVVLDRFSQQLGNRTLASISSEDITRFVETPIDTLDGLRRPSHAYKVQALNLVKVMFHREGAIDPFPDMKIKAPGNSRVMRDLGAHYKSLVSRSEMERFSSLTPSARIEKP